MMSDSPYTTSLINKLGVDRKKLFECWDLFCKKYINKIDLKIIISELKEQFDQSVIDAFFIIGIESITSRMHRNLVENKKGD